MRASKLTAAVFLLIAIVAIVYAAPQFAILHTPELIKKGPGVTVIKHLSDYFPALRNTPGETEVFILDSGKPGGTALLLGGTHPNEPSGYVSAILLLENVKPTQGRLIVIPRANASGFTHNDYTEGSPQKFSVHTASGDRWFRYGSRATNSIHQWPDPDIYVHPSGQKLSGSETRNLNRAYPGRENGTLTEQIAYGIVQVIKQERIQLSVDLHEASPEYPVINAVVAHENAMDIAANATINLQLDGVKIGLEPSPKGLRGLSHREWGDATDTLAILMETANPSQGRLRGATNAGMVVSGQDRMYQQAAKLGRLFVPFDAKGHPLDVRVARHITAFHEMLKVYSQKKPQQAIVLNNVPSYRDLTKKGVGAYL